MRNRARTHARTLAPPTCFSRFRTVCSPCAPLRSTLASLLMFVGVMVGASIEAQAKGKSRTWSPPIPPGRAAITLSIRTLNAANVKVPARVMWGRRLIGETPLSVQWPADSGPVDIVVQAPGHVPVHTRLYTFADDKVVVKLVDDEGKKTLFGYKREVPAPAATAPGATAPAATAPGATAPGATAPGATGPGATGPGATAPVPSGTSPKAAAPPPALASPPAAPAVGSPPSAAP